MTEVIRYDASRLGKAARTPQGFVKLDARLARTGVLEYRLSDGSVRRELRLPEEVFHPDSLDTAVAGLPITIGHPREMVNPSNVKTLKVGQSVRDAAPESGSKATQYLSTRLQIEDAQAISKIDAGELQELSCGYTVRLDTTPGVWNGQPYDAIQRQVRLNHVALLPSGQGRSGSDVGLRLDASDSTSAFSVPKEPTMLIKFDEQDPKAPQHEVSEVVAPLIQELQQKLKTNEARIVELTAQLAASSSVTAAATASTAPAAGAQKLDSKDADAKLGAAEARADQAEKALKDAQLASQKDLAERIDARVELIGTAKRLLGPDFKHQGLNDRAIREAVLTKVGQRSDGKSDGWVEGAFEAVSSRPQGSIDSLSAVVVPVIGERKDDALESPRSKALAAAHQAWQPKK